MRGAPPTGSRRRPIAGAIAALLGVVLLGRALMTAPPPPAVRLGTDTCGYCLMILSVEGSAAATRDDAGQVVVFDDIGCMVEAIQTGRVKGSPEVWVEARGGTGWRPIDDVTLWRSPAFKSPMNYGIVAYPEGESPVGEGAGQATRVTLDQLLAEPRRGLSSAPDPRQLQKY